MPGHAVQLMEKGVLSAYHSDNHKDSLEICIEDLISKLPPLSREHCCIYRVPKRLRDLNEKAYTPQIVSIGPLHYGNTELQGMEEQKLRSLQALLHRPHCASLDSYTSQIRKWEAKICSYYNETIEPTSSDEFVKMILLDSAFIIQVILNEAHLVPHLYSRIQSDMALLENQIPFFIIELLFNVAYPSPQRSFIELCIGFFEEMFLVEGLEYSNSLLYQLPADHEVKHFVDLLRLCHLPSFLSSFPRLEADSENPYIRIHCATLLKEAGIKFGNSSDKCVLDITYDNEKKMLKIPQFVVSDSTESVLRNMVVLEQFQYVRDSYVTNYIMFLDDLIDTSKDADILIQSQIIKNDLADSSAVSKLFNNLANEVTYLNNYSYHAVSQELDAHCKSSWNKWKAILKHDYFRTPWMIGSTTAAIVLLILTLIQTICSIIQVA